MDKAQVQQCYQSVSTPGTSVLLVASCSALLGDFWEYQMPA